MHPEFFDCYRWFLNGASGNSVPCLYGWYYYFFRHNWTADLIKIINILQSSNMKILLE